MTITSGTLSSPGSKVPDAANVQVGLSMVCRPVAPGAAVSPAMRHDLGHNLGVCPLTSGVLLGDGVTG